MEDPENISVLYEPLFCCNVVTPEPRTNNTTMSSNGSNAFNQAPEPNQRQTRSTRSGRRVREPVRYEPDPNVVLEDDFSDCDDYDTSSETDSITEYQMETDDDEFVSDICDSGDESESDSEDDLSVLDEDEEDEVEDVDEDRDSELSDVIDLDCLTDNASDGSVSSDEEEW